MCFPLQFSLFPLCGCFRAGSSPDYLFAMALGSWLLCFGRMPPWFGLILAAFLAWWSFLLGCNCLFWRDQAESWLSVLWKEIIAVFQHSWVGVHIFPLASAVQSLGFLYCCFWLPPRINGKNWHHNASVFHHILVASSFVPCLNPAQQMCYLWQTFLLFQQSMLEHLQMSQLRETGAVTFEQTVPHSVL